jgi:L-asparaginase II
MSGPVLVEVMRGGIVESTHRGAAAVVDLHGRPLVAIGDIESAIFPRSAVKALQALPLVESGAAEHYRLSQAELALACSSHGGEPRHVASASAMLTKTGRDKACLECGSHWPLNERAARALAAAGLEPTALNNNCSGKHAGFICVACANNDDPKNYIRPDHPVQRRVKEVLENAAGVKLGDSARATDGCSIPTYALPLRNLALAFAKFGTGIGLSAERAAAAKQLREAVTAEPFMVAGTDRFDTMIAEVLEGRAFTKIGAEGVCCAALPESGLGIAVKCYDGAGRAAEAIMAAFIQSFLSLSDVQNAFLTTYTDKAITNWNGIETGRLRVTDDLELPALRT